MCQQQMRIGMSLRGYGYHLTAWRHPDVPADASVCIQTFLETISKCLLIKEIELGVSHFALAIGKPSMSDKRTGKTVVYCRDRIDASRNGSAYP
jgi:hypothetical protein